MKQLIRISLCKMAFELEQDGYSALSAYLDQAKTRLQGSPDQQEIVADLERSIAEKLAGLWGATLVDAGETGHINAASGHGPWPEGLLQFGKFLRALG